jgi:hypothetical protein
MRNILDVTGGTRAKQGGGKLFYITTILTVVNILLGYYVTLLLFRRTVFASF